MWSDVKDDTICGSCYVLAEDMYTHATCSNYCAAQGLNCTAAFEESSNSCAQAFPATCDYDFASYGTSDALCECTKPGGTPAPTPQQYCDESTWSDVKDGIVCADCYVLAENMYSHATCAAYCAAQGLSCVDAYEESSNSCVESFNVGCDFDFASYGTSDALCQCATVPVQPTPLPGSPTSKPTFTPTPAPTRTPVVVTSVGLSGITCTEFDADIFESGMDTTIGEGDATFDEILCADDSSAVTITTEVTVDLAIALANPSATNVMEHIIDTLDASTLETNIIAAASSRRRLGGRRRLGMESISVASVGVSTFAPSAAPTPSPTAVPIPSPTAKPTLPPTALPISAPTIA